MCRDLRLEHTYLCRDERGGSLPDEVGSSPQVARKRKEGEALEQSQRAEFG
jgi:hypothetical protein